MIKTITYTKNVPPSTAEQVAKMACEYAEDISLWGWKLGHPLYCIAQVMQMIEHGTLMSNMGRPGGTNGGLIVAIGDSSPNTVLGYLIYMPLDGVVGECGVNYMAVHHDHRRRGIASALLSALNSRFKQSTLTCQIPLVPMYEKFGFKVIGHHEWHISMTNGLNPSTAGMKVFNPEDVMDHPMLRMVHDDLLGRLSQAQVNKAMESHRLLSEQKTKAAELYAKDRIASRHLCNDK